MAAVLNQGLHSHPTKYQAKFRRWYDNEQLKAENKELSPQEIQKRYPEYHLLIDDMKNVNKLMPDCAKWLRKIVEGEN